MEYEKGVDTEKWDKLIELHYQSAIKRNPAYGYSKEEHKEIWVGKLNRNIKSELTYLSEETTEEFIKNQTLCNNTGYKWNPA